MALFVSLVYGQHWHEAVLPIRAPLNDVRLILTLEQYPDKVCSVPAIRAIYRHLWYLSEDLIGLAFLDDQVDVAEKTRMQASLKRPARKGLKRLEGKGLKVGSDLSAFEQHGRWGFSTPCRWCRHSWISLRLHGRMTSRALWQCGEQAA